MGAELGIPITECFLEMKVTLPDGKAIHQHKQRSHSWVRNAYNVLFSQLAAKNGNDGTFGAGKLSGRDTGGNIRSGEHTLGTVNNWSSNPYLRTQDVSHGFVGNAGDNAWGIQIGTGTNAESFEDYALQTPIANGSGAGQMAYSAGEATVLAYDASTRSYSAQIKRYINNNSAGDIAIAETGLICRTRGFSAFVSDQNFLYCRDRIDPAVTIPASGQVLVTYTISLVYPS